MTDRRARATSVSSAQRSERHGGAGSIGELRVLAEGSLSSLFYFRHHNHPHRDPDEEVFAQPTIIFTVKGCWHFQSLNTRAAVDSGTVVLGRAGQLYRCRHDDTIPTDQHFVVHLSQPVLQDLASRVPFLDALGFVDERTTLQTTVPKTPAMARLQRALAVEAAGRDLGRALKIDLAAMELLLEIARISAAPRRPAISGHRTKDGVEAARAYLASHLDEEITLASLARVAGLSSFHFSRAFAVHVGLPPRRYLTRLRIEEAMRLLRSSSRPVTEICYEVGFTSLSHFINVFRQHTGVTPSECRRQ